MERDKVEEEVGKQERSVLMEKDKREANKNSTGLAIFLAYLQTGD